MQTVDIVKSLPKVDFGTVLATSNVVKMYKHSEENDRVSLAEEFGDDIMNEPE